MYRLGLINSGTLRQDIQSWFANKLNKEDPNSKIGADKYVGDKDHFWALKGVSFEVKQGDRLGIIGKNGAGKSTLLKMISRISAPTEGIIKIKGKIASLLEVGTGFHGELTGRENIYLNGAIMGMKKRVIDARLDSIIDFSGIEHHIDTPVKRYSSGMYVRLGFAVAAHLDSDILIADEVLAVGDAEFQRRAIGKMEDLSTKEGRTVLFVSHNLGAVKKLCNYGILLDIGKILKNDRIDDCISLYTSMTIPSSPAELITKRNFVIKETLPFQIEYIEILDKHDNNNSIFEAHEEIKIRFIFISRKPIPELYGCFFISRENGEEILVCDSTEDNKDIFNNMSTGKFTIELKIFKGLLSYGEYLINIGFASVHIPGFKGEQYLKTLKFRVVDSLTKRGNNRGSVLSTVLDWKIVN